MGGYGRRGVTIAFKKIEKKDSQRRLKDSSRGSRGLERQVRVWEVWKRIEWKSGRRILQEDGKMVEGWASVAWKGGVEGWGGGGKILEEG
jgi:hypothetical protein